MINFTDSKDWLNATKDLVSGAIFIKHGQVSLDDLMNSNRPGAIIRCHDNPKDVVMIIPPQLMDCDFIAGMISDEA